MIKNYANFEEMYDRAIAIASLKAYIWERDYGADDLEYIRHDGECITVIGTYKGIYILEEFPVKYLSLGDAKITALEEAKFYASKEPVVKKDIGVYIGLKN